METLHAILYLGDAYIATRDPVFLQRVINGLVTTFKCVGLETNTKKTQAMTCTPGKIRGPYQRMRSGRTSAVEWDTCTFTCRE